MCYCLKLEGWKLRTCNVNLQFSAELNQRFQRPFDVGRHLFRTKSWTHVRYVWSFFWCWVTTAYSSSKVVCPHTRRLHPFPSYTQTSANVRGWMGGRRRRQHRLNSCKLGCTWSSMQDCSSLFVSEAYVPRRTFVFATDEMENMWSNAVVSVVCLLLHLKEPRHQPREHLSSLCASLATHIHFLHTTWYILVPF